MSTQLQSVLPILDDVLVHILLCHHNVYSIYCEIYNVKFNAKMCIIYEYSNTSTFLLQIYIWCYMDIGYIAQVNVSSLPFVNILQRKKVNLH